MTSRARLDLVLDCADPRTLAEFWCRVLDYRVLYSDERVAVLVPTEGLAPPLLLQGVPEPKTGKNRMHLDVTTDDVDGEVARLEALGARRTHDGYRRVGAIHWVTMADPEANEFCVCTGVEW